MTKEESKKIYSWAVALILLAFTVVSCFGWIADSEFWPITASKEIFNPDTSHPSVFYKFFFYLSLAWIHFLPLDAVTHVMLAKLVYSAIGAFNLFLIYRLSGLQLTAAKSFLFLCFLLSSALIFAQVTTIRSDVLTLTGSLLVMGLWPKLWQKSLLSIFLTWTMLALAFAATTPKALFAYLFLLIGFCAGLEIRKALRLFSSLLLMAIFFLVLVWLSIKTEAIAPHVLSFLTTVFYAEEVFKDLGFLNLDSWTLAYLRHDFLFFVAGVSFCAWSGFLLWKKKSADTSFRPYWISSTLLGLSLFFIQPNLPFFAVSVLSVWTLSWLPALRELSKKSRLALLTVFLLGAVVQARPEMYFVSNQSQMKTLRQLEDLQKDFPDLPWLDGMALIPQQKPPLYFVGPWDTLANEQIVNLVRQGSFGVIIYTRRLTLLGQELNQVLDRNYRYLGGGVWLHRLYSSDKKFVLEGGAWQSFYYAPLSRLGD